MIPSRVLDRVFDGATIRGSDDCWLWNRSVGSHGNAQIGWWADGRSHVTTARRVAWTAVHGTLADDLAVIMTCHDGRCVNPRHMRAVTGVVAGAANGQTSKTHCPIGHPYAGANLHTRPNGERRCRACAATRYRARTFADRMAARALAEFYGYYETRLAAAFDKGGAVHI